MHLATTRPSGWWSVSQPHAHRGCCVYPLLYSLACLPRLYLPVYPGCIYPCLYTLAPRDALLPMSSQSVLHVSPALIPSPRRTAHRVFPRQHSARVFPSLNPSVRRATRCASPRPHSARDSGIPSSPPSPLTLPTSDVAPSPADALEHRAGVRAQAGRLWGFKAAYVGPAGGAHRGGHPYVPLPRCAPLPCFALHLRRAACPEPRADTGTGQGRWKGVDARRQELDLVERVDGGVALIL